LAPGNPEHHCREHDGLGYDVAPDGRFLVSTVNDEGTATVLVQNWLTGLKH